MTKHVYRLKLGARTLGTYGTYEEASAEWDRIGRPVASIVREAA